MFCEVRESSRTVGKSQILQNYQVFQGWPSLVASWWPLWLQDDLHCSRDDLHGSIITLLAPPVCWGSAVIPLGSAAVIPVKYYGTAVIPPAVTKQLLFHLYPKMQLSSHPMYLTAQLTPNKHIYHAVLLSSLLYPDMQLSSPLYPEVQLSSPPEKYGAAVTTPSFLCGAAVIPTCMTVLRKAVTPTCEERKLRGPLLSTSSGLSTFLVRRQETT